MTTAEDLSDLADQAYTVDPLDKRPHPAEGSHLTLTGSGHEYEVLKTATDPVTGFQGLAVVPFVGGKPDYSQVIVAYAGTNFDHRADQLADVSSVIGGASGLGTQVDDALRFAHDAQAKAAQKSGRRPSMSTTGHSLGGYLALLVAAEKDWPGTGFNAPDPYDQLTPDTKKRLKEQTAAGKKALVNYVNEWDVVGGFKNGTGAAVYVKDEPGRDPLKYHNLDTFTFEGGSVVGAGVKRRSDEEILANLVSHVPGGSALVPLLGGTLAALRNPAVGAAVATGLAGAAVAIDTVAALHLAASVAGTTQELLAIKSINDSLVGLMQEALEHSMSTAHVYPFVTEQDIVNCVDAHRLWVHQSIDETAVAEVSRLLDDHIVTVGALSDGITQTVQHALQQDAQWASAFAAK